jgi:hypothetical protein
VDGDGHLWKMEGRGRHVCVSASNRRARIKMFVVALNNVGEADIHARRRRLKLWDSMKKGRNDLDPNQVKVKVAQS